MVFAIITVLILSIIEFAYAPDYRVGIEIPIGLILRKTRNRFSSLITNNSTTKNPMLMVFNRNCCQYVCKKLTPTIEHGLNLHISIVILRGREIDFRRQSLTQQPRILCS